MSKDTKSSEDDSGSDEQDETSTPEYYYSKSKIPTYKVILIGDAGAGKSSLFWRYKYGAFGKGTTLPGTDRFQKEFVNDKGEKMQVCFYFYVCWLCRRKKYYLPSLRMNLANTQTLPAKMYQFVTTLLYRRNVKVFTSKRI